MSRWVLALWVVALRPAAADDAATWLRRALQSSAGIAHLGRVNIITHAAGQSSAATLLVKQVGGRRRIEYLSPPELRGQVVVVRAGELIQVHRDAHDPNIAARLGLLKRNYHLLVNGKGESVAGRRTVLLTLDPFAEGKGATRLWLDEETALPLRADRLAPDSDAVLAHMGYEAVDYALDLSPVEGEPADSTGGAAERISLADARAHFGPRLPLRDQLPLGFVPEQAALSPVAGGRERLHVVYSDGLLALSLFFERPADAWEELRIPRHQRREINGRTARIDTSSPLGAVEWQVDDVRCSLVGDLAPAGLLLVAGDLVPLDRGGELQGRLPTALMLLLTGFALMAGLAVTRRRV